MLEIRLHGRGGQGGVTAAELIAQAAISEGKYAQGFPSFGPERRGAPITAYIRVSDTPIYLREPIDTPGVVVVMDATLIGMVDVLEGMIPGGTLVVNTLREKTDALKQLAKGMNISQVDATAIASETLGVPITNTAIIGAIIKATGVCDLASLEMPLTKRFGRLAPKNWAAMQKAFEETFVCRDFKLDRTQKKIPYAMDAYCPADALEIGAEITDPGSSRHFKTGNWRTMGRPVTDYDTCIKCGFCWIYCPDIAYSKNDQGFYNWDGSYCKGCAICAQECPKGAITMEGERS